MHDSKKSACPAYQHKSKRTTNPNKPCTAALLPVSGFQTPAADPTSFAACQSATDFYKIRTVA